MTTHRRDPSQMGTRRHTRRQKNIHLLRTIKRNSSTSSNEMDWTLRLQSNETIHRHSREDQSPGNEHI